MWGATLLCLCSLCLSFYFNPHSPCGERLDAISKLYLRPGISIHTPRVGSDAPAEFAEGQYFHFNPHSPCGERRACRICRGAVFPFQSTLLVWGATGNLLIRARCRMISIHTPRVGSDTSTTYTARMKRYFNPHSPCGERLVVDNASFCGGKISIHTPRVGSDQRIPQSYVLEPCKFQSTLPVWGATRHGAGGAILCIYFNPHSPCGERPFSRMLNPSFAIKFQSTLPVWGATLSSGFLSPS